MKYQYFTQCDNWRRKYENGERDWQEMMANKVQLSNEQFEKVADTDTFFDPDDEDDNLENYMIDDAESACYRAEVNGDTVLFFQTGGFEFIFTKDGEEPSPSVKQENDSGMTP